MDRGARWGTGPCHSWTQPSVRAQVCVQVCLSVCTSVCTSGQGHGSVHVYRASAELLRPHRADSAVGPSTQEGFIQRRP